MSDDPFETELLSLSEKLLKCIAGGDWQAYAELCADDLTAFEPESRGQQVVGLAFHRFYFELDRAASPHHTTLADPRVRRLGPDAALVTYVRLSQRLGPDAAPVTGRSEETRVWQRIAGRWQHVHFHRSVTA